MKHIYLLSISSLVLLGCTTENNPTFTLTTTVSPAGSGSISPTQTTFNKGDVVILQANPQSGWKFVRWEGDINKTANPLNFEVSRNFNLTAIFEGAGLTDIDGNAYPIVQIGTQIWMASNLKTTRYRDGSTIPSVTNATSWAGLTTGAWVNYDNNAANDAIYGKLYNWYAVANTSGLCPTGWHVPSDAEWTVLSDFLGTDAGFKMKSTTGWNSVNGSNTSGFNGLPGGYRHSVGGKAGTFDEIRLYAHFWTSSPDDQGHSWSRRLFPDNIDLGRYYNFRGFGFSVRCIRD